MSSKGLGTSRRWVEQTVPCEFTPRRAGSSLGVLRYELLDNFLQPLKFTLPSTDQNAVGNYAYPATVWHALGCPLGGSKEPQLAQSPALSIASERTTRKKENGHQRWRTLRARACGSFEYFEVSAATQELAKTRWRISRRGG